MENNQERKRAMDDEEERKQAARSPFEELNQVHSDFAIAMALQEQERAFDHTLSSIESDSEEGEEDDGDENSSSGANDYEYFENEELEFLEGEDSNGEEEDMEEDDIDPDELSYEELIALGEFIGEEKRGLTMNEIKKCLSSCKYKKSDNKSGIDRCVICQVEYEEEEQSLVALPCHHSYHSQCITNWLKIKKNCPICSFEVSSSKI